MASTTGIESWAVDLADVGPIYPFQGSEMLLAGVAFVIWIGWHVLQFAAEKRANADKVARHGNRETIERALEKHGD